MAIEYSSTRGSLVMWINSGSSVDSVTFKPRSKKVGKGFFEYLQCRNTHTHTHTHTEREGEREREGGREGERKRSGGQITCV